MASEIAQVLYDTVLKTPYAPGERYKLLEAVDAALEEVRAVLKALYNYKVDGYGLCWCDSRKAVCETDRPLDDHDTWCVAARALYARLLPREK